MNVLLLSKYGRRGASSRLRSYQHLPGLSALGISVRAFALFPDDYLERLYEGRGRLRAVLKAYWTRVTTLLRERDFDLVWLEKEALPWIPHWLERALLGRGRAYVVDYDDAVFHQYELAGRGLFAPFLRDKIRALMRRSSAVIAGSDYLCRYAALAGAPRVVKIPTVVDLDRYPGTPRHASGPLTLGWIGTPLSARYLIPLLPLLQRVCHEHGCRVVAVGAGKTLQGAGFVEAPPWSEAEEAAWIRSFDIGLMPLSDRPYERGKCGYKLIQYMACAKPVIASPVGENRLIVRHGGNGLLAESEDEWRHALDELLGGKEMRLRMGLAGRALVEAEYSLATTTPKLAFALQQCA